MYAQVVLNLPLEGEFTYLIGEHEGCQVGVRVVVPFGRRELTGFVVALKEDIGEVTYEIKTLKRVVDKEPLFGEEEIELALWMSRFYLCSFGEALSTMIPSGRVDRDPPSTIEDEMEEPVTTEMLSAEQSGAINSILESSNRLHYLYGVTGSGKSEVFLRIAEALIAKGQEVIYLVPEITLTHQLARQVSKRFEGKVAILHSGLTPSQRIAAWRKIIKGEVKLAIGARSAIFAPFKNLGLIVIDEEHENSYKSGSNPRYHARQIAQRRATTQDALLVMGSATPSLEAWHMMEEGVVERHHLVQRVAGGIPPEISVVNMLAEESLLSKKLVREMKATLDKGRQVILFLNRRGFSYFFHCRSCGYEMSCPHCSVALTFHKGPNRMMCHYCSYNRSPITVCPECSSLDVGYGGFGTEMVEKEVQRTFPLAKIARLDTDTAGKQRDVAQLLSSFRGGEIDILLGTQMVAKGLNFPKVDLVGIVLADSGLNLPDFRSQERTFALIVQVSGRTGRFNQWGKVVVQTYRPDNMAIRMATEGDLETFYTQELAMRRETSFPPFSRLINFVIRGGNKSRVTAEIEHLRLLIETLIGMLETRDDSPSILGVAPCPLEKIANKWRYHLVLRGGRINELLQIATAVKREFKVAPSLFLEIDVDPLQLL